MKYIVTAAYAAGLGDEPQVYETDVEASSAEEAERLAQEGCRIDNGQADAKPGDGWYMPLVDVAVHPVEPPKVEILHVRDPDCECEMAVWINGVEVKPVAVEDIDPGRGYARSEWEEGTAFTRTDPRLSEGFRAACVEARESMNHNKYIED